MRVERAATRSAGVPSKTIRPPSWPAPRPDQRELHGPGAGGQHRVEQAHPLHDIDRRTEEVDGVTAVPELELGTPFDDRGPQAAALQPVRDDGPGDTGPGDEHRGHEAPRSGRPAAASRAAVMLIRDGRRGKARGRQAG